MATSKRRRSRRRARVRTVAPFAPALDDRHRGELEQALDAAAAEERLGLGGGREQEVRGDLRDERAGRAAAVGEQRPDRGEVDADDRARRARQLDRAAAGLPERLAEQRVDRQVEGVGAVEPRRPQVVRREQVGRATVGHEAALAAGCDEDADPAGPRARDARRRAA